MNTRATALFALAAATALVAGACGDAAMDDAAEVRVVVQYATAVDVIAVQLSPALAGTTYDFNVSIVGGTVAGDPTFYQLDVTEGGRGVIHTATFRVPNVTSGAVVGDTGSGSLTILVVPGATTIVIPFVFDGTAPTGDVTVNVDFEREPTITSWSAAPARAQVPAAIDLVAYVSFANPGPNTVTVQLYDLGGVAVGNPVNLSQETATRYLGGLGTAGLPLGNYTLNIDASDGTNGTVTSDSIPYTLF